MESKQDRLSNLPKIILHNILSRLPDEDAARSSVLSKAWAETWFTFPILSFSHRKIVGTFSKPIGNYIKKSNSFPDHVKKRLLRLYDKNFTIKEFKLCLDSFDEFDYMSEDIDLWLKLVSESGIEVVELCLSNDFHESLGNFYVLPKCVIESKSLTKLVLTGGIRVDQAFLNDSIKLLSLRVLSLWYVVSRDEHAIKHLISRCPLIEHVSLRYCSVSSHDDETNRLLEFETSRVMKSLSLHGLLKLKTVEVDGIQEVYIDAQHLENFRYCMDECDALFDIDRCKYLKGLDLSSLKSITITDKWFLELFLKFPFLESLKLDNCAMSERISISSAQLKVFQLSCCSSLKEVKIDGPNLLSFGYCAGVGYSKPPITFLASSSQLELDLEIYLDFPDLCSLREFLQNIKPQNVLNLTSLSMYIFEKNVVNALNQMVFQGSSPPPSIKHLHLRAFPNDESLFSSIVNILLSCCCPATISFRPYPYFRSIAFIEFFYETLMRRKDNDCFCSSNDTKCWWHDLKDVKVTSSTKIDNFKKMLESLQTFAPEASISFSLEF